MFRFAIRERIRREAMLRFEASRWINQFGASNTRICTSALDPRDVEP
jgi:hypothetical protein